MDVRTVLWLSNRNAQTSKKVWEGGGRGDCAYQFVLVDEAIAVAVDLLEDLMDGGFKSRALCESAKHVFFSVNRPWKKAEADGNSVDTQSVMAEGSESRRKTWSSRRGTN